jgi:Tol biopolymer transport system component
VIPRWSLDGQAIVYTERQNGVGNLWEQPLAGGPPQQLSDFKTDLISNFTFSRDGKNIVLARGPKGAYVVLIRDFK